MSSPPSAPLPFVSVIMPVRNEEAFLERSLGSVLRQDYPHDRLEVIVADGRSTDGTRQLVEMLGRDRPVRWVDNPGRIAPTGLNAAIAEARGDIVVRVDGHCEIAPDYVRRCVDHLQEGDIAGVGGPLETIGESPLSEAIAVAMSSSFGVGGSAFRTGRPQATFVDTIAFGAYPTPVLQEAGPFDEELIRNQDDEYNYRLRKAGGNLLLAPDVRSRYYSRATLRGLWRQYFQYGFWKVRVLQKHPRQMSWRQFVPPSFVGVLGLGLILALASSWRAPFIVIVAAYGSTNGLATVLTASRRGWRFLPWLPLLFATLHFAYGSGFLVGLLRFAPRWAFKESP